MSIAAGDPDGDGKNEIISAASPGGGPHVRTFNLNMAPLDASFYAYGPTFSGGVFVAAGPRLNAGGVGVVIAAS